MQKFKIIKTTNKDYVKIETQIQILIEQGNVIESITPIVTNSYKSNLGSYSTETEILVFLLYREVESNDK